MAKTKIERYSQIPKNTNKKQLLDNINGVLFIAADAGKTYNVKFDVIARHFINKMIADGTLSSTLDLGDGLTLTTDKKIALDFTFLDERYIKRSYLDYDVIMTTVTSDSQTELSNQSLFKAATSPKVGIEVTNNLHIWLADHYKVYPKGSLITTTPAANLKGQFIYISVTTAGVFSITISAERRNETKYSTCAGMIDANGVIQSVSYTRLGKYRVNKEPRGSSAPSSKGSAADTPTAYWLTEQY